MSIPKKIHYCWFGGAPLPALAEKCIKSWKKYCPDFEIVRWDESNFDFSKSDYCREAYEAKKWAFVTDYARLAILQEHGGVYFDTDVELLRPIDDLLELKCFMGIERSINYSEVATGLGCGSEAGNSLLAEMMQDYDAIHFIQPDGSYDMTTCTVRNTSVLKRYGFVNRDITQQVGEVTVFSTEYFSPMEMESGIIKKSKNTYSIHHYGRSWVTEEKREKWQKGIKKLRRDNVLYNLKVLPNQLLRKCLGEVTYEKLKAVLKKRTE